VKLRFFNATVYAIYGVYAGTAGASFCEINILHHFYALKSRIQVQKKPPGSDNPRRLFHE